MNYPQDAFSDKKLSLKAKGLLAVLGSNDLAENFNITAFGKHVKEGRDSIRTAIDELIKHGYCKRETVKDWDGRYAGYKYKFSYTKIQS